MMFTDENYWDCECEENYIHAKACRLHCYRCGADENDMPDARPNEIRSGERFASVLDLMVAAHDPEYADDLAHHLYDLT